jgi:hypothetical protein
MSYGEFQADAHTYCLLLMNETSGTAITDTSMASHDGTANGEDIVTGYFGNSRRCGGAAEYITFADHADWSFDVTVDYSWEFLFYPTILNDSHVLFKAEDVVSGDYVRVFIGTYYDYTNTVTFRIQTGDDNNKVWAGTGNGVLTLNQWNYIVAQWDSSLLWANRVKIYVNGRQQTIAQSSVAGSMSTINPSVISLGRGLPEIFASLQGRLDSFRYTKGYLRTSDEIYQEYAKIKGAYGVVML